MFHVPVPMNRFGRRLPGFTELFLSTFPQKSFTSFLLLLLFSLKIKNRTTKQWPSPLFLFPVLTRFSFEERGDLFDFLFFFLGYGDGWRPTWRRLKKKKMAADFLPSLKKKIMATATFRSGTIRSIGRSNQSGNSIEKKN